MPKFNPTFTPEELQSEEWRQVSEWPEYEVSSLGRVRSHRRHRNREGVHLMHPHLDRNGYLFVNLRRNGKGYVCTVHGIVARAFIGPCPNGYEIDHKDRVKTNCRPSNLEYVTHQVNMKRAADIQLWHLRGSQNGNSKLTEPEVKEIKRLLTQGISNRLIANRFKIDISTIYRIRDGVIWGHVKP